MTVDGAILVGGQSRRFGSNKADIQLNDQTLLERTLSVMKASLDTQIFVVGGDENPDGRPNVGPLGGLETAFNLSTADALIVVACDMPGISVELLQFLANHPSQSTVLLPRLNERSHPLCARWCRSAAQSITHALDQGRHGVMELLSRLDVTHLEETELADHQINTHCALFNVNRPEDLVRYQRKFRP